MWRFIFFSEETFWEIIEISASKHKKLLIILELCKLVWFVKYYYKSDDVRFYLST